MFSMLLLFGWIAIGGLAVCAAGISLSVLR